MLESLTIAGLGVIDSAELEFGSGFTVLTGETGAGKTMVVTALGLLLGGRADSGAVRQGAKQARVEGALRIDDRVTAAQTVVTRADDAGAEIDDGCLILARTVSAEGRSRAFAGGAGVPAALLAELAQDLVAVHGQNDQQRLLGPSEQRDRLDAFGGDKLIAVRSDYRDAFERLSDAQGRLDELSTRRRERAQEADALRFAIGEIDAVGPREGEDDELRAEASRLAHVDGLRRAADEARTALSGDETAADGLDAMSMVAQARRALDAERGHDTRVAELADQLASASYALADTAADVAAYAADLEVDPARLQAVQERRAALGVLLRKYGDRVDDVLAWHRTAVTRLAELDDDDTAVERLTSEVADLRDESLKLGRQLTGLRGKAGTRLGDQVTAELAALAMPHAVLTVSVTDLATPSPDGLDEVAFLFSAHDGAELRPLQRGASGGELSRVMLAIEVCMVGSRPVPTMVFDEVDAGVGGKSAVEVGRRLARLARDAQVVVVTHLPQVAAFADEHFAVVKDDDGHITTSGVTRLDEAGRRSELSRMLAGLEDSDTGLAHADELVAMARQERAS
jgi:DNA repair protein RecN (Recombination protein N)